MNGFLPIYTNFNTKECLLAGNEGQWQRSFFAKSDNNIPAFQSRFVDEITSVTEVKLRKLHPDNVELILSEIDITVPFISLSHKTINGKKYSRIINYSDFFVAEIVDEKGVFDLKITVNNGTVFYSELFQMLGTPIAVYQCSNANFDIDTNIFSIDIARTDTDPDANSKAKFMLKFLNSLTDKFSGQINQSIDFRIGESRTFHFDIKNIIVEFDFFVWSGACNGQLEIYPLIFEDGLTLQTEDNYFAIQQ